MGKTYNSAPLVEANCDFLFEPSQPWDWTVPGLVYASIKVDFPKKKQQNVLEVELKADQTVAQTVKGGTARMQFLSEDEKAIIQIGPDLLAVNRLSPYLNWDNFKRLITRGLEAYRNVVNPKGIRRIGLRYINRIEIPEARFEIEDYLLAVPTVPEPVPQIFARWLQRVEIPFVESNGIMGLQSASIKTDDQASPAMVLDMTFTTLDAHKITLKIINGLDRKRPCPNRKHLRSMHYRQDAVHLQQGEKKWLTSRFRKPIKT